MLQSGAIWLVSEFWVPTAAPHHFHFMLQFIIFMLLQSLCLYRARMVLVWFANIWAKVRAKQEWRDSTWGEVLKLAEFCCVFCCNLTMQCNTFSKCDVICVDDKRNARDLQTTEFADKYLEMPTAFCNSSKWYTSNTQHFSLRSHCNLPTLNEFQLS